MMLALVCLIRLRMRHAHCAVYHAEKQNGEKPYNCCCKQQHLFWDAALRKLHGWIRDNKIIKLGGKASTAEPEQPFQECDYASAVPLYALVSWAPISF